MILHTQAGLECLALVRSCPSPSYHRLWLLGAHPPQQTACLIPQRLTGVARTEWTLICLWVYTTVRGENSARTGAWRRHDEGRRWPGTIHTPEEGTAFPVSRTGVQPQSDQRPSGVGFTWAGKCPPGRRVESRASCALVGP